jgi:NDP-sugar pyrophosphorylase family protein
MSASRYQGVILAAGHGARMGPFGAQLPKPIVPICNRPLLAYQLDYMREAGIEEVFIVIGHLGHRITQTLGDGTSFGVRIEYVEQHQRLGIAHAVGQLESRLDRPFLLMLGDIFFEIDDIRRMIEEMERHGAAAVLAVKEEIDVDAVKRNFSVLLHDDGTVKRVIEKPRHVPNMLKGCGLYLFDLPVFDAIRRTPRTAMRDEYELTDSIQILIDYEYSVRIAPVVNWDINLTYTHDLIDCSLHQLRKMNVSSIVGEECSIVQGVRLLDTVVGDRVTIRRPITLERCVVLSRVTLDEDQNYTDTVLALPDRKTGAPGLIQESTHGNW